MLVTTKNYTTAVSADVLSQAKKNKVRECDELEKGNFVAYVDEGSETFDVSISINSKQEITRHACDCFNNGTFCRHKVALLMHLTTGKAKKEKVVIVKKKASKIDSLLESVDQSELKEWVGELISKNKDIELSFVHKFSKKALTNPQQVIETINETLKAIVGKKRDIDLTQLKKMVELWEQTLSPLVSQYIDDVTNEHAFLNIHVMTEACLEINEKYFLTSNRIVKFIEKTLNKSVLPINELMVEESWNKAVNPYFKQLLNNPRKYNPHYLRHLKNIIAVSTIERKLKIIEKLAAQFEKSNPDRMINGTEYSKIIFEIINENELFQKYNHLFKPLSYENNFNLNLIEKLIAVGSLDRAKKYCEAQIALNYKDEYSLNYYLQLKEIAMLQNDEPGALKVSKLLFPYYFDFNDYHTIIESLPDAEKLKWRQKMVTRARNVSYPYKLNAQEFIFELAAEEKRFKKMIEYIEDETPYHLIIKHFDNMFLTDKDYLIKMLFSKSDDIGWRVGANLLAKNNEDTPQLADLMIKNYKEPFLKTAIAQWKKNYIWRNNGLVEYLSNKLS